MSDVYVLGIDMIKFGRYPNKTVPQLGAEAVNMALDDAGVTMSDIEGLYCGNFYQASGMVGQRILQEVGQSGIPVVNVANACATGATAFREAWMAVKAGVCDIVLAVGVEQMGKGMLGSTGGKKGISKEGLLGSASMPATFAAIGQEHASKHGTTYEQFAKVSVKNHKNSTMNPKAMYQKEASLDEVMSSEMIAYPNTKLMCSVNVDGAAAAVLVSESKAKELGMTRAVRVAASALASDPYQSRNPTLADINACTRLAAKTAYDMAGISADDLDLVELHDCFATAELVHYENLGLCQEGEAGRLIDEGETETGRENTCQCLRRLVVQGPPHRRHRYRQHL